MDKSPQVSVVLCCYNAQKTIAESIESVLNQTFTDFEFIIWDDCSTDNTPSILKNYNDKRIRVFFNQVNRGLGKSLQLACREVNGKYIARMDSDDLCMPERLQKEYEFLESHPGHVLVSSSVIYIDENDKVLGRSFPWTWAHNQNNHISVVHPATMFRTDAYRQSCGYLDLLGCEDRVLWSKLIDFGKFSVLKEPLLKYRMVSTSLSHMIDSKNPYKKIMLAVRSKMCNESEVLEDDIELQNHLYRLGKKYAQQTKKDRQPFKYNTSIEEKAQHALKYVLGEKMSTDFVFFLKNTYVFLRNRKRR